MADVKENDRVRVSGFRELAGTNLPLWCNGATGRVVGFTIHSLVRVKLDGVSAKELTFLPDELEKE
jgi:hypothetical protein